MAVYGQAMKRWESWLLWMAADVLYVPLYHHKGLDLTAILYVGFFLLCLKGWLSGAATSAPAPIAGPHRSRLGGSYLGGRR